MPIKRVDRLTNDSGDEVGIRLVNAGRGDAQVLYADVQGGPWNAQRLERFRQQMQDEIDERIALTDAALTDDPDAATNPGRADFFHDGADLVARAVIISDVSWDGATMQFTVTRAR